MIAAIPVGVTTGSFLGAWLWSINPRANFVGAALIGLIGTLWFWWFIQRPRSSDGHGSREIPARVRRSAAPANAN